MVIQFNGWMESGALKMTKLRKRDEWLWLNWRKELEKMKDILVQLIEGKITFIFFDILMTQQ